MPLVNVLSHTTATVDTFDPWAVTVPHNATTHNPANDLIRLLAAITGHRPYGNFRQPTLSAVPNLNQQRWAPQLVVVAAETPLRRDLCEVDQIITSSWVQSRSLDESCERGKLRDENFSLQIIDIRKEGCRWARSPAH